MSERGPILRIAAPIALTNVAFLLNSSVDVLMVGQLGALPLAAMALGAGLINAAFLLVLGLLLMVAPLAAAARGAGRTDEIAAVVRQGFWIATGLGLPLAALTFFGGEVFAGFGVAPDLSRLAGDYTAAAAWGVLPQVWMLPLRAYATAMERPGGVLAIVLVGATVNVGADYAFIFGLPGIGLPALGVAGAGYATSLVQAVTVTGLILLVRFHPVLRQVPITGGLPRLDPALLGKLLVLGAPACISITTEAVMLTGARTVMGQVGTVSLAGFAVCLQLLTILQMAAVGFGQAAAIRTAVALGSGDAAAVRRATLTAVWLSAGVAVISGAVVLAFEPFLVGLFVPQDSAPDAYRAAREQIDYLLPVLLLYALVLPVSGALRGIQRTRPLIWTAPLAYLGIGLAGATLLVLWAAAGRAGVWAGLIAAYAASVLVLAALLSRYRPVE